MSLNMQVWREMEQREDLTVAENKKKCSQYKRGWKTYFMSANYFSLHMKYFIYDILYI